MHFFANLLLVIVLSWTASVHAAPGESNIRQAAVRVDALLAEHQNKAGLPAHPRATDETFVRRVYLDLAGRIPTLAETQAFLGSNQPAKRAELIQTLLASEGYVSNFYNFWADILRLKSHFVNTSNVVPAAYEAFLKESLRANKPYDRLVHELLSARGLAWESGAVGYYLRDPEMPLENMAITSRIFLGTRIECAQCHDHPFDKWRQTEFYHLAAYTIANRPVNEAFGAARDVLRAKFDAIDAEFKKEKAASTDNGKAAEQRKQERQEALEYRKVVGIIKSCVGQLFSPVGLERKQDAVLKLPSDFHQSDGKPGDLMEPRPIFGAAPELAPGADRAEAFARWLASPANPAFARVIVNRLWKRMFGVALTEPLDELTDHSKSMAPALETFLQTLLVDLGYDLRAFLAVVANTRAYQSDALQSEFIPDSVHAFQGPLLRRMTAEQIWDSLVALANPEPDMRDRDREERNRRRVAVSHMAFDAYQNVDGSKVVDIAYANLAAGREFDTRERAVKEALVVANRSGDKERVLQLRREEGTVVRERGESMVREFILPLLENLARLKGGPQAKPIVDDTYKTNPNPAVLVSETWRRMYVPGYGPVPRSVQAREAGALQRKRHLETLAARGGFSGKDCASFAAYVERAQRDWVRASELDSPAPRGHFLRTMGQSDRDFVENANPNASIPQALALLNGELLSTKGLLSTYSPLMCAVNQADSPQARIDTVWLALLSRRPTSGEHAVLQDAASQGLASPADLIYALLNSKQFLFVR